MKNNIYNLLNKKKLLLYLLFSIFVSFENLILPVTVQFTIKSLENNNVEGLFLTFVISSIAFIIGKIIIYIHSKIKLSMFKEFNIKIKSKIFLSYYKREIDSNKLQNILYTDIPTIGQSYIGSITDIMYCIILSVVSLIYILNINIIISLIFIIFSILPIISQPYFSKRIYEAGENFSKNSESYIKDINENINGIKIIKHYLREKYFFNRNLNKLIIFEESSENKEVIITIARQILMCIYSFSYTLPFIIGGYLSIKNSSNISGLIAIYLAADRAVSPIMGIVSNINKIKSSKSVFNKVNDLIQNTDSDLVEKTLNKINISFIKFENATFGYNFPLYTYSGKIEKGDKILLIGPSGSGKSTFLKTLFKEIDLLDGDIFFDEEKLSIQNRNIIFNTIGYIPQETIIFDETVKFNITLGEEFSDNEIIETLKESGFKNYDLESFINKKAGIKGENLSGGERARINIARALIRDYDILFIDEFSASLDNKTSTEIRDILLNLDCTVIEISHHYDKNDLARFDKIINITDLIK